MMSNLARTACRRWLAPHIMAMSRALIIIGIVVAVIGVLWPWLSRLGLGRLPGDILIERGNFTFYAPIATGLLLGILVSVVLWLINR